MLSDYKRDVMKLYGVLGPSYLANRTTFVIDTEGKIVSIEEGSSPSTLPAPLRPAAV